MHAFDNLPASHLTQEIGIVNLLNRPYLRPKVTK